MKLPDPSELHYGGRYLEQRDPEWASPAMPHLIRLYEWELDPLVIARDPDGSPILDSHRRIPTALAGWALHLTYEKNPLPENRNGRKTGWRAEAATIRAVKDTARALVVRRIPPQDGITIRLDWEVVTKRDRDEDNLVKCMKALTDGIRLAGIVPNDTRQYVKRLFPEINLAPVGPGRPAAHMRLWIWPGRD